VDERNQDKKPEEKQTEDEKPGKAFEIINCTAYSLQKQASIIQLVLVFDGEIQFNLGINSNTRTAAYIQKINPN
jgi:hypothetical protein